ncbi:hypothetical protein MTO96_001626 [Rhipicephalus appendiculatus]
MTAVLSALGDVGGAAIGVAGVAVAAAAAAFPVASEAAHRPPTCGSTTAIGFVRVCVCGHTEEDGDFGNDDDYYYDCEGHRRRRRRAVIRLNDFAVVRTGAAF